MSGLSSASSLRDPADHGWLHYRSATLARQRPHAVIRSISRCGSRRKLRRTSHGKRAMRGVNVSGSGIELVSSVYFLAYALERRNENLLAPKRMFGRSREAGAAGCTLSARFTPLFSRKRPLLVAQRTKLRAQRFQFVEPHVIDGGMMTGCDGVVLLVIEKAAFELQGTDMMTLQCSPMSCLVSTSMPLRTSRVAGKFGGRSLACNFPRTAPPGQNLPPPWIAIDGVKPDDRLRVSLNVRALAVR